MAIQTVADLRGTDIADLQRRFNVVLARTAMELNGIAYLALEEVPAPRQQIIASRSFGRPVTELALLREAVAFHTARGAAKLRREGLVAGIVQVLIATNPFKPEEPQYQPACCVPLPCPSADPSRLIQAALAGLQAIFRDGYRYQRAGVVLLDLAAPGPRPHDLFAAPAPETTARRQRLLSAMDAINARWGRGTLRVLAEGLIQPWRMRRDLVSPAYTTDWKGLPVVG